MFDPRIWAAAPFHLWTLVFFVFGAIVGSFLNVCIYRMPRGVSVISPPSHCPHCGYSIPWYLNVPLLTWLYLGGKCANCHASISIRYFLVELLTACLFLASWLAFGPQSAWLALAYCVLLAGFIVATFIDFEHFIIPDEITIGGMVAGFLFSAIVPVLHADWPAGGTPATTAALKRSGIGMIVGGGVVYAILRLGKLLFGRHKFRFEDVTRVVFTETSLHMPGQQVPYEEIFYRRSDTIVFEAQTVELIDRCYRNAPVRISPVKARIAEDEFNPEDLVHLEATTREITVPREAMGLGDVKFMAAIGSFLGWQGALFSLMVSAIIGSMAGVALILLKKREWASRLPYGPYIALAATVWIFGGRQLAAWWLRN
jgi:leader peptidase (prepilin peptidase)/N-methyltransferase